MTNLDPHTGSKTAKTVFFEDDLEVIFGKAVAALPTVTDDHRGGVMWQAGAGGVRDKLMLARKSAADANGWVELATVDIADAAYLFKAGDTATGPLIVKVTNAAAFSVQDATGASKFAVNTSTGAVTMNAQALDGGALVVGTVHANRITDATLTNTQISAAANIQGSKLLDDSVPNAKLITVDGGKIIANSIPGTAIIGIPGSKINDNSVDSLQIAPDAITNNELALDSVGSNNIIANSITGGDIQAGAIGTSELASGSVTSAKLDNNIHLAATVGGVAGQIAFFDGVGVPQRTITGSRGGNAALADLLADLDAYGLILNNTTA